MIIRGLLFENVVKKFLIVLKVLISEKMIVYLYCLSDFSYSLEYLKVNSGVFYLSRFTL
ncbi:hypothetical protein ABIE66_000448 [Peribacillus sp. B2I2]